MNSFMGLLPDIILAAIIILAFITGAKKGLIKSVWHLGAWVAAIVLTLVLVSPATSVLRGTSLYGTIRGKIMTSMSDKTKNVDDFFNDVQNRKQTALDTGIPEFLVPSVMKDVDISAANGVKETLVGEISDSAANVAIKIIAFVALLIIIRLLLSLLYVILNALSKLPLIKTSNRLLGGLLSVINVMFIVYVILAVLSYLSLSNTAVYDIIDKTYMIKYFYNSNMLLKLSFL